jgi:hypothetical protein
MNFFERFALFAIGFVVGLLILKYRDRIVYTLGKNQWAEQKLGSGGTYTVWQFIGITIIALSFLIALIF